MTDGSCSYTLACVSNACETSTCQNGMCDSSQVSCDDQNPCTDDSCGSGGCTHSPHMCDDGVACTTDTCTAGVGCVFTPVNDFCNDNNLCTDDICNSTGCVFTPVVCYGSNPCANTNCSQTLGCIEVPIDCSAFSNAQTCTVAFCPDASQRSSNNYTFVSPACVVVTQTCYSSTAAIVGGAIGAAAVVGIVCGLIFALGICSGGAYAYYNYSNPDLDASVFNSPLYEASGKNGENPLYTPGTEPCNN